MNHKHLAFYAHEFEALFYIFVVNHWNKSQNDYKYDLKLEVKHEFLSPSKNRQQWNESTRRRHVEYHPVSISNGSDFNTTHKLSFELERRQNMEWKRLTKQRLNWLRSQSTGYVHFGIVNDDSPKNCCIRFLWERHRVFSDWRRCTLKWTT